MGLILEVVNHDKFFEEHPGDKIFVNDFNLSLVEEKEQFERILYTHYKDSESIESSVSCDCGEEVETYKLGIKCDVCRMPVVKNASRPIVPSMWIRAPEGVRSLISPTLWIMLSDYLVKKDFDFLEYLTNTSYRYDLEQMSSKETKRNLDRIIMRDLPRGLNNFIDNFDEIIEYLMSINLIGKRKLDFKQFLDENKDNLFPQVLPIPSKLCFVVESTTSGIYIDKPIGAAVDGILTIAGINSSATKLKPIIVQNRTARALKLLGIFHDNYSKQRVAKKPGIIRKHVLGSRINLTARAVITSISEPHDYDEIHIPWGLACQLLKYHIINKLKAKFKMTAREAISYVYSNAVHYDQTLDDIFKELIQESKYKGLPCILARN